MKCKSAGKHEPGYPSILELALKAGRWSVVAGSSALIIGTSACGPIQTMGVIATDEYEQDSGRDATQDTPAIDTGLFADPGSDDVVVQDAARSDAGAFVEPDGQVATDIQNFDEGIDQGPTAGVPYEEDGWGQDTHVQDPDNGGDADLETEVTDSVEVDPGIPLPGEPIPDIFPPDDAADVQE